MGNMLDFFRGPKQGGSARKNTISVYSVGPISKPMLQRTGQSGNHLPRAVAVYGAAAGAFAVITLFYLIKGPWWTGVIMILPTFCLGGFAWYYLKISGTKPW